MMFSFRRETGGPRKRAQPFPAAHPFLRVPPVTLAPEEPGKTAEKADPDDERKAAP